MLLSLCITTRNRSNSLFRLLTEISSELNDMVELVIVDGASTDGTSELISSYARGKRNVKFHLEALNSGLDQGYDKCVTLSTGKYCWLLSDDDQIIPGSIGKILEVIQSKNYDLLIADSQVWDSSLARCLLPSQLKISFDTVYTSNQMEELFIKTATVLSFIGSVIIKRNIWLSRDREKYYGTWFVHLGVIFQQQLKNGALVISSPLIKIRYGVASWSHRAFDIWMKSWPLLIWSFHTISESAKNSVVPMTPGRLILKHILFNCHGVSFEKASEIIPASDIFRRFVIRGIYLLPAKMCNLIVSIACYMTIQKRLLMLYDMASCSSSNCISRWLYKRSCRYLS